MDDSNGQLSPFAEINEFSVRKHNDAADPSHFKLCDFVVLGSEIIAHHRRLLVDACQRAAVHYCWVGLSTELRCHQ